MIHRDIKPQNLMLTPEGQVRILGFGLARFALRKNDDDATAKGITLQGEVLGTPDFLAPEQARNSRSVDPRADLYSLGCTAYYLLTHRVPFPAETAIEKLLMHCEKVPDPIERLRPDLPPGLAALIRKLMAKKPEDRCQTAEETAEAFAAYVNYTPPPAPAPVTKAAAPPVHSDSPRTPAPRGRSFLRLGFALALGALAVIGFSAIRKWRDARPPSSPSAAPAPVSPLAESRKSAGPRVLYLLGHQDVLLTEFDTVKRTLAEAGYKVAVVALTRGPIPFADRAEAVRLKPDGLVGEILSAEFDALVIGGGAGHEEFTGAGSNAAGVRKLIGELLQTGKPVEPQHREAAIALERGSLELRPRLHSSVDFFEQRGRDGLAAIERLKIGFAWSGRSATRTSWSAWASTASTTPRTTRSSDSTATS